MDLKCILILSKVTEFQKEKTFLLSIWNLGNNVSVYVNKHTCGCSITWGEENKKG